MKVEIIIKYYYYITYTIIRIGKKIEYLLKKGWTVCMGGHLIENHDSE